MKKIFLLSSLICGLFTISSSTLNAQCLTDHYAEIFNRTLSNPDSFYNALEVEFEEFTKNNNNGIRREKLIIPVVFHVVHTNGPENISKEQILDQLKTLNEDFSQTNADQSKLRSQFKDRAANLDLEFRLAKIDPNGNCTDGIVRHFSALTNDAGENVKALPGAQWDYRKYLNIYVVNSIESSAVNGIILGYARFPFQTSAATDGILIRADRVGSIGVAVSESKGRTLTHEIGHWIGLYHTFQSGCFSSGDQVGDTPPAASSESNRNCSPTSNSCSSDFPDELDLWENYMDYSGDNCMNMFTAGQKVRSDFYMNRNPRSGLSTTSNLIATGVLSSTEKPIASFESSTRVVCVGEPVTFTDASCKGLVDAREWTFQGGSNATSTAEQPVITYSQPGFFKVSLSVSNSSGNSVLSQENYIEVLPIEGRYNKPVFESFESDIASIEAFDLSDNLRISSSAGNGSSQSVFAPIGTNTPIGSTFSLTSKDLNAKFLRGLPAYLSFQAAYAPDNNTIAESLRVLISTDCGKSYRQIYIRNGFLIGGISTQQTDFIPKADNDWRQHRITLNGHLSDNDSNFRLKIEMIGNGGNSIYLDNINLSQFLTSTVNVEFSDINIYPNPAQDVLNIESKDEIKSVELLSLDGKLIKTYEVNSPVNNTKIITLPINNLVNGAYIVRFMTYNNTFAQKIIVER